MKTYFNPLMAFFISLMVTLPSIGWGQDKFFNKADQFFQQYVVEGQVKYQTIYQSPSSLNNLVKQLRTYSLEGKSANVRKAFWINAYNIAVINAVIEHYPISSPKEVEGFFGKEKHKVAGNSLTLDEIEDNKLMKPFQDPRLHFVLVCAAKGCPQIVSYAYQPENLEEQISSKTKKALNDPDFIRLNNAQRKVLLSKIFKWYKKDFTTKQPTVIDYINQYRQEPIPTQYSVDYYTYDWDLNAKKNQ